MQKFQFKTKLTKKQKVKDIVILLSVSLLTYLFLIFFVTATGIAENLSLSETLLFCVAGLLFMCSMLGFPTITVAAVLGYQKGKAKRVRDNSTIVKAEDFEYYRDKLSDCNPSLFSILVDLDLYGKKDIVATLLNLYNKGFLSFENNGKICILNNHIDELRNDEKELIHLIASNRLNSKREIERWKESRFIEARKAGYIERIKQEEYAGIVFKKLMVAILFLVLFFVLWGILLNINFYDKGDLITALGIIGSSLLGLVLFIPWYNACKYAAYYKRFDCLWRRTELGNQEAEKIAGLQKFIQDFSLLDSAQKEAVKLWDDYLIYAIVLEENEEIVDDICKQYHIKL